MDAAVEGDEARIAFKYNYLTDVLVGDIAMEVSSATNPGVLKPAEDDGYVHVVMPMFVQWT